LLDESHNNTARDFVTTGSFRYIWPIQSTALTILKGHLYILSQEDEVTLWRELCQ